MRERPYSDWEEEDIQYYIDNKINEGMNLEYKRTLDIGRPVKNAKLCKVVSGMANAWGGIIIVGLKEADDPQKGSVPTDLSPLEDGQAIENAARIINDGIIPRLDIRFYPIEGESKHGKYWILHVPESLVGPHMVSINGENRYYRRVGFETRVMTALEIESAYRSRLQAGIDVERSLEKYRGPNANQHLQWPEQKWMTVVAIPRYPVHNLFSPLSYIDRYKIPQLQIGLPTKTGLRGIDNFKPVYKGLLSEESLRNEGVDRYYHHHLIYRSGAISIGLPLNRLNFSHDSINPFWLLQDLHDALAFIGGIFSHTEYYGTVELLIRLEGINQLQVKIGGSEPLRARNTINTPLYHARITATIDEIDKHTPLLLQEPMDILFQSFGEQRCSFYHPERPGEYKSSRAVVKERDGRKYLHIPSR